MLTAPLKDRTIKNGGKINRMNKMNKRKRLMMATIPILLLALLLIPATASMASGVYVLDTSDTGDGKWINDDTWQVEIYPGETKSTSFTLRNPSSSLLDVEVSITPNPQNAGNLTFELKPAKFSMYKGTKTIALSVVASNSATPGNYSTELVIKSEVPPPSTNGGGGGGGGGKCYLKIDMLGEITKARMSCTTDKTLEGIVASDKDNTCLLEID
ncbi:unnamed protein product, partial [marine sediment metagenome]